MKTPRKVLAGALLLVSLSACASSEPAAGPAGNTSAPSSAGTSESAGPSPSSSTATPDSPSSSTATPDSPSSSTATPDSPSSSTATPTQSSSANPTLGSPVATKSATIEGNSYTLKIYPAQRQDKIVTTTVDLAIDKLARSDGMITSSVLSDESSTLSGPKRVANGFWLIDPASATMYGPATTSNELEDAVCSPTFPNRATAGDVFTFTCTFAGVPTTLGEATLRTQSFGSFPHVPIR